MKQESRKNGLPDLGNEKYQNGRNKVEVVDVDQDR